MRKINSFYLIGLLLISFAACKKDSGGGSADYYIKASIGGTEKTFSSTPMVVSFNQDGMYSLGMSAGTGGSSGEGLSLQITQNNAPIAAGTYNESSSGDYVIAAVYNPGSSDVSAIYGAGLLPSTNAPLQIVITGISDTKVSGTFSGEFFDNSGTGSNSLMITNGSFNLPIQ